MLNFTLIKSSVYLDHGASIHIWVNVFVLTSSNTFSIKKSDYKNEPLLGKVLSKIPASCPISVLYDNILMQVVVLTLQTPALVQIA